MQRLPNLLAPLGVARALAGSQFGPAKGTALARGESPNYRWRNVSHLNFRMQRLPNLLAPLGVARALRSRQLSAVPPPSLLGRHLVNLNKFKKGFIFCAWQSVGFHVMAGCQLHHGPPYGVTSSRRCSSWAMWRLILRFVIPLASAVLEAKPWVCGGGEAYPITGGKSVPT